MLYKYTGTSEYIAAMEALKNTEFDYEEDRELIANTYASIIYRYPNLDKSEILSRLETLKSVKTDKQYDFARSSGTYNREEKEIKVLDRGSPKAAKNLDYIYEDAIAWRKMVIIHESIHAMTAFENEEKYLDKSIYTNYMNEACTEYMTFLTCKDLGIESSKTKFTEVNGVPVYGLGYQNINRAGKALEIIGEDIPSLLFSKDYEIKMPKCQYSALQSSLQSVDLSYSKYDSWRLTKEIYRINFLKSYQSADSFSEYMNRSSELYHSISEKTKLDSGEYRSQSEELSKQDILMWCKTRGIPEEKAIDVILDPTQSPEVDHFIKCCKLIRESGNVYTNEEYLNAQYAYKGDSFSIKIGDNIIEGQFKDYLSLEKDIFYPEVPDIRQYYRVELGHQTELSEYKPLGFTEKDLEVEAQHKIGIGIFYDTFTEKNKTLKQIYAHMNNISSEIPGVNSMEDFEKICYEVPPTLLCQHISEGSKSLYFQKGSNGKLVIENLLQSFYFNDSLEFLSGYSANATFKNFTDIDYIANVINRNPLCKLQDESNQGSELTEKLNWDPNYSYKGESLATISANQIINEEPFDATLYPFYKWKLNLETIVDGRPLREYISTLPPSFICQSLEKYSADEIFPDTVLSMEKPLFSKDLPQSITMVEEYMKDKDICFAIGAICHGLSKGDIPMCFEITSQESVNEMNQKIGLLKAVDNFCKDIETETNPKILPLIEETKAKIEIATVINRDPKWVRDALNEYVSQKDKIVSEEKTAAVAASK